MVELGSSVTGTGMSVGAKVGPGKGELANSGVVKASGLVIAPLQAANPSPIIRTRLSPYFLIDLKL
jgi:hypothetical protein